MSRQPSRFRRFTAAARRVVGGDGLHRCPDCGRAYMCPMEWETAGDEHWLIASRCGECGAWHEQLATNDEARDFDLVLARQTAAIAVNVRSFDRERMEAEIELFVSALDHDLIDAADFAR
jgi:hypothetical protein